ncbi:hypothetical protein PTT_18204 [Pyrenophora teres f. teres 0-1]|uniref:Tcp11 domain containing protein n=1 Tax=Pyrenophora teres f. teres (strain 0-1) TaxID=861557 RepID=E3S678_PYRTT|nr:hypothetical protein PTT_18204 [Pyrenophora teres f. teres 0-1]
MQKNCGSIRRQAKMGAQTPKTAATTTSYAPDHCYASRSAAMEVDDTHSSASSWHNSLTATEGHASKERDCTAQGTRHAWTDVASRHATSPSAIPMYHSTIPEELVGLLRVMIRERSAEMLEDNVPSTEELAEQFLSAVDTPPVTKQSLSELDIQSIITNMKLRHDVNFDRDLSFRPNVDGIKGQEKERAAEKYWTALIAELELYNRLFQGTPAIPQARVEVLTPHAQRRIPLLFQTVRDVLKSLVPERDHARVDEHLDIPMLMQAIERGVCDFVRLAEWMAQLLKEHCAPMRDAMVDNMVVLMKQGAAQHRSWKIVFGLKELFGVLEAMKLDVANHQIRNLKTLLIEDTVNFEKHYHLDRLVNGRARVNVKTAQQWFADAVEAFGPECSPRPRGGGPCFQLEVFTRAVVATIFGRDGRSEFPDTFFLDHDRLRALKAEVGDLVMFEVCMEMYIALARQFGYSGHVSLAIGQQLRVALSAIMGDAVGRGPQQWVVNSEALSLEILRQASRLAGISSDYSFDRMADANQNLRVLFMHRSAYHAGRLEASLLPQILANVDRHGTSSPVDLFTNLVSISPSMPPLPTISRPGITDTFAFAHLHPETAKLTDLANRITHITILHWRVWGPIAYVQDDESQNARGDSASIPPPRQPPGNAEQEASVPASMRTGEPLESGQEPHVRHHSLQ